MRMKSRRTLCRMLISKSREANTSRLQGHLVAENRHFSRYSACWIHRQAADYWLDGKPVAHLSASERARLRNCEIGFIFQAFNLIGDLSVYENIELPLTYRGMISAERKQRVEKALERVGLAARMRHYPSQLSGGQQQRVAVARALAGEPFILLADEPTGNLDSKSGESVMELLRDLHQEGATICLVTHDQHYSEFAERTIHLLDGHIVNQGDAKAVDA